MATTASIPAYLLPGVAVHQPPHLEGDASLATEILPGPPPIGSAHQVAPKRDGKKLALNYSYLPTADPGSTYSGIMHGTLIGQDHESPHSKRARIDKGTATGRAQRASARSQGNSTTSILDPLLPTDAIAASTSQGRSGEPEESGGMLLDDLSVAQQGAPATTSVEPAKDTGRPRRKDKGKGKEVVTPPLRVKEEPKTFSLNTPEPSTGNLLGNEDHCSACRSFGSLVYCDGCPRAFHLWCLNPPLEGVDESDARWFCPACVSRKNPPRKPPSSLLAPLIHQLQISNPVEFQLPDDIKYFFKDVASGPKGTYVDSSAIKPPRLNRLGIQEDRDPHRLRDRNGEPVLCYGCGKSALPNSLAVAAPASKRPRRAASKANSPDAWKNIISCDYCPLHWHLDCLDPPLPTMPSFNKKWMCPNHVERVLPPKRRIPKHGATTIEITRPKLFNNGNIDVIYNETSIIVPNRWVPMDEVLINGRRYRVPERIIVLDFWNKLNKEPLTRASDVDAASIISSPLSSLSSLDESDEASIDSAEPIDDLTAAQMLCGFSTRVTKHEPCRTSSNHGNRRLVDHGVQTDASPPAPPVTRGKVGRPRKYPLPTQLNGSVSAPSKPSVTRPLDTTNASLTVPRRRRGVQPLQIQPQSSGRELRSRSRNTLDTPIASESSIGSGSLLQVDDSSSKEGSTIEDSAATSVNSASDNKADVVVVKLEDIETSAYMDEPTPAAVVSSKRLGRTVRQGRPKDPDAPRRGRKRKQREDELPTLDNENGHANERPPDSTTKKTKANGPPSLPSTPLTIRLPPSRFHNGTSATAKPGLESPSRR